MRHQRIFVCLGLLLILPVMGNFARAQDLSEYSFCVDAGHGGTDAGAIGPTGLTEKEINLTTSFYFRDSLEAAGATVYMTRVTDATLSLSARSNLANSMAVDRCISVHHNASTSQYANYTGVHVYLDTPEIDLHLASNIVTRLDSVLNIGVVSSNCATWGVHKDNFHMVREPNMPCCLTENSFISNPAEETRLRNSSYLEINATAMFIGLAEHMETSPEPPPPTLLVPDMISVLGDSTGTRAIIHWWRHPVGTVLGFRLYKSTDGINWGSPILYEDSLTPDDTTVTIGDLQVEQIYYFKMIAIDTTYEAPESDFSNTYCLRTTHTCPWVLIVDGFDRRSSWLSPGHPFASYNARSLDKLDIDFETCSNEAAGNQVSLEDYDVLIWILGDEGTSDQTFDLREQGMVKSYLEGGGKLFVTGSEIGYDLWRGSSADRSFYQNYLKASYVGDDANDYTVTGVNGTIFAGLSFSYGQTYEEDYPDYINAYGGSTVNLQYSASKNAGVQYQGTFGSGKLEGKLVHMGFPWETIGSEGARDQIMSRVMDFFGYQTDVDQELADGPAAPPGEFRLFHNYPNPFNPSTDIRYRIPSTARVIVRIFNVRGQTVRTLLNEKQPAGWYTLRWDGRDDHGTSVASGTYFCQVGAGPHLATRKMVLIR
ncbi:N-acetylmuramoyl-L-alanine amidase [bacterium]|nr:N-acetylmuramoyl-L-alanine amidase [bacterium]